MAPLTGVALREKQATVAFMGTRPGAQAPTPGRHMCSTYTGWARVHRGIVLGPNPLNFMRFLSIEGLLVDLRVERCEDLRLARIGSRLVDLLSEEKYVYNTNPAAVVRGNCSMNMHLLDVAITDATREVSARTIRAVERSWRSVVQGSAEWLVAHGEGSDAGD